MNLELVETIVSIIDAHPISEITVEQEGHRVLARKSALFQFGCPTYPDSTATQQIETQDLRAPAEPLTSTVDSDDNPIVLTSPMVGLFHHRAQPVPYGGLITAGQVVGSIESMKLLSDVLAEQGGRVVEVLIEDGAPVEYGQPLFRLAPA